MILLFNSNHQPVLEKKVIQIKPVDYFKKQQELEESPPNEIDIHREEIESTKKELKQLQSEKERLLQSVQEEIETEKHNWQKEKEHWIEQAKQEGYNAGFALGKEDGYSQYKALIDQANSIIQSAREDYYQTVEQNEETIIHLAMHTAEKILQQKIADKPEMFINIVRTAIQDIKDQSNITIYLHPANYQFVLQQKEELMRLLEKEAALSIHINERLAENACIIEHPYGQIDASVDTQLTQIRQILQEFAMEKNDESS